MRKIKLFMLLFILSYGCFAQVKVAPTSDGYIYLGGANSDKNYGLETNLKSRYAKEEQYTRQSYIRFDLKNEASYFSSAKFYIYGKANSIKLVDIYSAFGDWTDSSLKGSSDSKPSRENYVATFEIGTAYQYYEVDLTDYINYIKSIGKDNLTLVLVDRVQQAATDEAYYHSKENTSGNIPYLLLQEGVGTADFTNSTYYIDAASGNDALNGTSPETAWKSLKKVESKMFYQGDKILFKKGTHIKGSLFLKIMPNLSTKMTQIGAYGEGNNPIIDAEGKETYSLMLFNTSYIEINDLTITQTATDIPSIRRGLYYQAEDMGEIKHIHINGVAFKNITGNNGGDDGDLFAKRSAGLSLEITGNNVPTYLNDYRIENCYFYKVGRHGAVNQSTWSKRTLTENTNWVPSKNIVIRNNIFEETASDGLIVRVADGPLMEHNLFKRCSVELSGNACFAYNCDNALWQYNEACYTVYNTGDVDAAGFDSDYMTKNTVFQFNYAHHNEFGDMLITGGPSSFGGFNDGTIVRYNVFYNNGHHGIRVSGSATNAKIYNNVIYKDDHVAQPSEPYEEFTESRIFYHKNWGGWPKNIYYANNIYYYDNASIYAKTDISASLSTGSEFFNNIIYATKIRSYPKQTDGLRLDPLFNINLSETEWNGLDKMLNFKLKSTSPAIDKGINIENSVTTDYSGTAIPQNGITDIGAFEYNTNQTSIIEEDILKETPIIIDNPIVDGILKLRIDHSINIENIEISIYSFNGNLLRNFSSEKSFNSIINIDVSTFQKGAYIVKINTKRSLQSGIFLIA